MGRETRLRYSKLNHLIFRRQAPPHGGDTENIRQASRTPGRHRSCLQEKKSPDYQPHSSRHRRKILHFLPGRQIFRASGSRTP